MSFRERILYLLEKYDGSSTKQTFLDDYTVDAVIA